MKQLIVLSLITLQSCGSLVYLKGDEPIIISSIQKEDKRYIVEAYGINTNRQKSYVYFETQTKYSVGDTIHLK